MSKFIISKRKNAEFQFNLKAGNNEVILTSEGYKQKSGCKNGIQSVIKNSANDKLFDRKISKNGKHYFNLKSTNGQVVGTSEMYESESSMENGIASVKKNASVAQIVDETGFSIMDSKIVQIFIKPSVSKGSFLITKRKDGEFQFNLRAGNHEVILTSEGYKQASGCKNGIQSVIKNSVNDKLFERCVSGNGKHFFNLKSTNGQVIGTSEMYESSAAMENGIESVMKNAPGAKVINRTGINSIIYKVFSVFSSKGK